MGLVVIALLGLLQAPGEEKTRQAIALLDRGEVEEARAILQSVVEESPRSGPARLLLGQIAVGREDWGPALEHLQIAVESSPQRLFLAFHLLGRAREATGDEAGARDAFERALELAPRFLPARLELARRAETAGDLWTALAHYRSALEIDPARRDLLPALANTARRMGAKELARCAVDEALESEPDNGALHYLRTVVESGDAALASCRRAIELGFENAAVYVTLGNLLHERLDLSGAIAAFEQAVAIDPAAAESLASFALTSLTTADYARLRDLLERHVSAHPDNINTLYAIGAMHLADGDLEKARSRFEHLRGLLPGASQVRYNLAMVYARQGDEQAAARERVKFEELRKKEDEEWTRQNELHRARVAMKDALAAGNAPEAARLGRLLADSGSAETEDFVLLGEALARMERLDEARRALEAALAKDPYDRPALEASLRLADAEAAERLRERLELLSLPCVPGPARDDGKNDP